MAVALVGTEQMTYQGNKQVNRIHNRNDQGGRSSIGHRQLMGWRCKMAVLQGITRLFLHNKQANQDHSNHNLIRTCSNLQQK